MKATTVRDLFLNPDVNSTYIYSYTIENNKVVVSKSKLIRIHSHSTNSTNYVIVTKQNTYGIKTEYYTVPMELDTPVATTEEELRQIVLDDLQMEIEEQGAIIRTNKRKLQELEDILENYKNG